MLHIESAGLTDVGQKREANEDAYLIADENRLYVVADGMGGHLAGEVASSMVVDTLRECLHQPPPAAPAGFDTTLSVEANRLVSWIKTANSRVYERSTKDRQCRGMGSTLAAVYCCGSTLIAANVGDSPIYLVRSGETKLISAMHTWEAEQKTVDPAVAKLLGARYKHMLSRAIGVGSDVVPDVSERECYSGDTIIICSDGLSNLVMPVEMIAIAAHSPPDAACRQFVGLANQRGGDDNITVIVLRVVTAES